MQFFPDPGKPLHDDQIHTYRQQVKREVKGYCTTLRKSIKYSRHSAVAGDQQAASI
jgi:hypothetical protein